MLYVEAFSTLDKQICEQFLEGHRTVLKQYNIENITTNGTRWIDNSNIYGLIIRDEHNEILAGIRVQVAGNEFPLPLEEAVGKMDKGVSEVVKHYTEFGAGELCGLWVSKKLAGKGVALLLSRAGISIVNQLSISYLFGLGSDYTLKMFSQVGFVPNKSLGTNGYFDYPSDERPAQVLGIINAITMETAQRRDRARMLDLRKNPVQSAVEQVSPDGSSLEIEYNLVISNLHNLCHTKTRIINNLLNSYKGKLRLHLV